MEIKNNIKTNLIGKFILEDLPEFIVITGENGTGKTTFLKHISMNLNTVQFNEFNQETRLFTINDNNREILTVNHFGSYQFSSIHQMGMEINDEYVTRMWGKLPSIYNSFINLKRNGIEDITTQMISDQHAKEFGSQNNHYNQTSNINITNEDYQLCKLVYENKSNKFSSAQLEDFLVNILVEKDELFSVNLSILYLKYLASKNLNQNPISESPIALFNKVLKKSGFPHQIKEPIYVPYSYNFELKIENTDTGDIYPLRDLSNGESTILSIIIPLFNKEGINVPDLVLLDEPDASLHPSLCKKMIDILKDILIEEMKCKVIITTHSPTTVALCEPKSIYRMDKKLGYPVKDSVKNAILSLTEDLENITIYYENRKDVFVESGIDREFYEIIHTRLKHNNYLEKLNNLNFVKLSTKNEKGELNGGCSVVKKTVADLTSVDTIFGLIDHDKINVEGDKIFIFGEGQRYSVENFILDPVYLCAFLLLNDKNNKVSYGFAPEETYSDFKNLSNKRIQTIIETFLKNYDIFVDSSKTSYETVSGFKFFVPNEFFSLKGHDLERVLLYKVTYLRHNCDKRSSKNFRTVDEIEEHYKLDHYKKDDKKLIGFFNKYHNASIIKKIIPQFDEFIDFLPKDACDTLIKIGKYRV